MHAPSLSRRRWLGAALCAPPLSPSAALSVEVPILELLDIHGLPGKGELQRFRSSVWEEAVRTFRASGVHLRPVTRLGELLRYPSGRPRFLGLERRMLNVVLTATVPLDWDSGRSLSGVTTIYEGYHISVIALKNAHANRVPLLVLNTVVHELLHAFRGDIFVRRTGLLRGEDREAAVDWQATRLWLFGGSSAVQQSARDYVRRLRAHSPE